MDKFIIFAKLKTYMIMEKKLYPIKFVPVASKRPWGGDALVNVMGKDFVECDENGNEVKLGADVKIGESWELADMGIEDSVISDGWLAGNTISEVMETYLERIVGEDVYKYYEFDCETGNLVEKEVDKTDMPHIRQQAFKKKIDNTITFVDNLGMPFKIVEDGKNEVKIIIEDSGIGIPQSVQHRVFERFFRVDKARSRQSGGTGLGLAIVKHIVSSCNGIIKLNSIVDRGTKIEVVLPKQ